MTRSAVKHQECSESVTAERYILGELSAIDRDRFEEHYFECPHCADAVRALSGLRDGVRAGLCRPPEIRPLESGRWLMLLRQWLQGPRTAVAVAALALAAISGYQVAQIRSQLHPQVLRSVALQPATRGDIPRVIAGAGPFVLLEADLPGASGDVSWTVEAAGGTALMRGTGPAPEPGLSFKVLVPTASLADGQYMLKVRSEAGKETVFRFQATAR